MPLSVIGSSSLLVSLDPADPTASDDGAPVAPGRGARALGPVTGGVGMRREIVATTHLIRQFRKFQINRVTRPVKGCPRSRNRLSDTE
ncbi:hypothetical protein EVAR_22940_1 [Eumeta japonica]|uniref:Uncharacterized protein n=1 Tax=Eumeta variegata TaxID=151549 RepID=A0A4C1UUC4_EUMVA|nr:hypothetical protein EVAR_22940_1 [Eumeta japonica]